MLFVTQEAGASPDMERPLSPYMFPTWHCFQITSVLSILHRSTGMALAGYGFEIRSVFTAAAPCSPQLPL
jgi:succinate dehydrogenase/fumarate reductase cytochrome b subunit